MSTAEILDDLVRRYGDLEPARADIARAIELLLASARAGGKILICGNGGSAADASHIAGELLKSFGRPRPLSAAELELFEPGEREMARKLEGAIPALSLCDQGVIHTAFGNDVGAELTFAQLVWGLGRPGDVLWAITTSGKSANILHALTVARRKGLRTVGLLGRGGGPARELCDAAIVAPGEMTQAIQERHLPIYHAICLALEEAVFGDA